MPCEKPCEVKRGRYSKLVSSTPSTICSMLQVDFMRRHKFEYEAVAGEEYELLKPDLVKVQESLGNFAFATEVKQTSFKDAFFKVSALADGILPEGLTG